MSVPFAYASIILIWSTTPLAVRWSTEGTGFAFAVLARMLIGVVVATLLLRLGRHPIPLHARARRAYLVGGLGLFGTMALTYWGARHVGSGLISVLFGLSPLVAGVFATRWLGERNLTPIKIGGMLLSAAGLALIFLHDGASAGSNEAAGVCALLGAVLASSASLVGMKRNGDDSPHHGDHAPVRLRRQRGLLHGFHHALPGTAAHRVGSLHLERLQSLDARGRCGVFFMRARGEGGHQQQRQQGARRHHDATHGRPRAHLNAQPARTPSLRKMMAAGQKPVTLACSMFTPMKTVNHNHSGETKWASAALARIITPAKARTARSMFMRCSPEKWDGKISGCA